MALKDRLESLKRDHERRAARELDRPKLIGEWQEAVTNLYDTLRGFLAEYDRDGLIKFHQKRSAAREEALGQYDIPELEIRAPGARKIKVLPVARMISGAVGRVDMQASAGDAAAKITLLRRRDRADAAPSWVISAPIDPGAPAQRIYLPLSQGAVEDALEYLLR